MPIFVEWWLSKLLHHVPVTGYTKFHSTHRQHWADPHTHITLGWSRNMMGVGEGAGHGGVGLYQKQLYIIRGMTHGTGVHLCRIHIHLCFSCPQPPPPALPIKSVMFRVLLLAESSHLINNEQSLGKHYCHLTGNDNWEFVQVFYDNLSSQSHHVEAS